MGKMSGAMITRCRLLLFGFIIGSLGLGAGLWLVWPSASAINELNAARIQTGMTLAEVEAILGGPARDETGGRGGGLVTPIGSRHFPQGPDAAWTSEDCAVSVYLREGRVYFTEAAPVFIFEDTLLRRVRRWIGY
jgi:hypothetical protein